MGGETFHIAFASLRFSSSDGKRGPAERECLAVLWAMGHFRTYLAGRRFTLITDCSALTWLLKSSDLSPKLHLWVLQLMEYDLVLQQKPGLLQCAPDVFSRLPPSEGSPPSDIDTSFPRDQPGKEADYLARSLWPKSRGRDPRRALSSRSRQRREEWSFSPCRANHRWRGPNGGCTQFRRTRTGV